MSRGPGFRPGCLPAPHHDEIQQLAQRLSPRPRKAILSLRESGQRMKLLQQWVRASVASRLTLPQVSDEEIQDFYAHQLTREQRARLESLPRERLHQELRRMYFQQRWKRNANEPRPALRSREN